ncbi:MAG: glycosyltransferase [Verrucomicrobiota bacterium]
MGIGSRADNGQPPTLHLQRIGATAFGRGTFVGKLLDYATYYLGASWKLLTMRPPPDRIVALTTPPYLSVVARVISKLRGADHAHWVMDLYPDVLAAHGMLDERGLVYRMLAGLARWGFGGTRCAALLTLGPDMAERMGRRMKVDSDPLSGKTHDKKTPDARRRTTEHRVHWVALWGGGERVGSEELTGKTQDNKTQDTRQEAESHSNIEHRTPNIEHRTEEDCGEELTHSAAASLAAIHDPPSAIDALALRQARGWNDDDLVVMYSGNMGLGHRFGEILAAASSQASRSRILDDGLRIEEKDEKALFFHSKFKIQHSKSSSSALRFVFFGGGKRREEVARFVRENPACGVELHDYAAADDLTAHLQSADVHLASLDPAWTGTMVPSKVQGIFAAGRPVIFIGSALSSIGRWVMESGGGWVVAPGDVAGLLDALAQACDPTTRTTRGHAAQAFAGEHFNQARNVARVVEILTR